MYRRFCKPQWTPRRDDVDLEDDAVDLEDDEERPKTRADPGKQQFISAIVIQMTVVNHANSYVHTVHCMRFNGIIA